MRTPKHKYKNYVIERCFSMSGTFTHFEAAPEIVDQLFKLREDNIRRPWHGNDCVCEECTYTEEEHAHNRAISDKCRDVILSRKVATIKKKTLKECKRIIDERESSLKLLNTTKESA